jgi:hypothetical protein
MSTDTTALAPGAEAEAVTNADLLRAALNRAFQALALVETERLCPGGMAPLDFLAEIVDDAIDGEDDKARADDLRRMLSLLKPSAVGTVVPGGSL